MDSSRPCSKRQAEPDGRQCPAPPRPTPTNPYPARLHKQLSPWVVGGVERRHVGLDQHRTVFQQRVHKAPRGQLRKQVGEELDKALAVEQRSAVGRAATAAPPSRLLRLWHHALQGLQEL